MNSCFYARDSDMRGVLQLTMARLTRAFRIVSDRNIQSKRASRAQILPSSMLSVRSWVSILNSIEALRKNIADCLEKNDLQNLQQLTNDEKRNFCGAAGRISALSLKAAKYHLADHDVTKASFHRSVLHYDPVKGEADDELCDLITATTMRDIMQDSRPIINQIMSCDSVSDFLSVVPAIGRTVTTRGVFDGAKMNPYLVWVVGLPTCIKTLSTHVVLNTPPEELNMRALQDSRRARGNLGRDTSFVSLSFHFNRENVTHENYLFPRANNVNSPRNNIQLTQSAWNDLADGPVFQFDTDAFTLRSTGSSQIDMHVRDSEVVNASVLGIVSSAIDTIANLRDYRESDSRAARSAANSLDQFPPDEFINNLLILPGTLVQQDPEHKVGWLHQIASYMNTRDPTNFDMRHWLGMMAGVFTFCVTQDVSSEYMRSEIQTVKDAFREVYSGSMGIQFQAYVDVVCSTTSNFRRALITSSKSLPSGVSCEHLTKFVFALGVGGGILTSAQLKQRQCALLIEMFHRSDFSRPEWTVEARGSWVEMAKNICLPVKTYEHYFYNYPNKQIAWKAFVRDFDKILSDFEVSKHTGKIELDVGRIMKASHYQFDVSSIESMFRGLAFHLGIHDYDSRVEPALLLKLVNIARTGNNIARNSCADFTVPISQENFDKLGRRNICQKLRSHLYTHYLNSRIFQREYDRISERVHLNSSTPLLKAEYFDSFKARYGVDLSYDVQIQSSGISKVACLCYGCPHFLKPLGKSANGKMSPGLKMHLSSLKVVPGLHKALNSVFSRSEFDLSKSDLVNETVCEVLDGTYLHYTEENIDDRYVLKCQKNIEILLKKKENMTLQWQKRYVDDDIESLKRRIDRRRQVMARDYPRSLRIQLQESVRHQREVMQNPDWVHNYISNSIAVSDYTTFERAVLKTRLRCEATGRFLMVRP